MFAARDPCHMRSACTQPSKHQSHWWGKVTSSNEMQETEHCLVCVRGEEWDEVAITSLVNAN
jgi:hypothetical protein